MKNRVTTRRQADRDLAALMNSLISGLLISLIGVAIGTSIPIVWQWIIEVYNPGVGKDVVQAKSFGLLIFFALTIGGLIGRSAETIREHKFKSAGLIAGLGTGFAGFNLIGYYILGDPINLILLGIMSVMATVIFVFESADRLMPVKPKPGLIYD